MRAMWGIDFTRRAILAMAFVNAALFSAVLPLWEGFDEAFHYSYVEGLWQGRAELPADVVASFQFAPVSHVVKVAIPEAITYDVWFKLSPGEREDRQRALNAIVADPRPTARGNYEKHQPPLAYVLLAPIDWSLSRFPLVVRVLVLRLVCGIASVLLLYFGTSALCRALAVPEPFATAVLFSIFTSEMFYATTAHVANDWLAVGIAACFFAELAAGRSALRLAAWLAAGLWTKAYFLVLAAFAVRWRKASLVILLAAPWYVRNLVVRGSLGGSPEAFDGIGIRQTLAAARHIDWPATLGYLSRASLWTGNNSFNTYSRTTLNLLLVMMAVAVIAWLCRAPKSTEWLVFAAVVVFVAAVLYEGCAMVADRPTQQVAGPSPWYPQVLLAPVWTLAFLGLSRWQRAGRALAFAICTVCASILVGTWIIKLFPMYAPAYYLYVGRAIVLAITVAAWALLVRQYVAGRGVGDQPVGIGTQ